MNDTSAILDTTRRDQDCYIERIEKLETDLILLKDEHDTRLITLGSNISYIKDNYVTRSRHEEALSNLKTETQKELKI